MRDEDHADVELALDLLDQLEDLRLHGDVECGRRLVADQHGRVVDERHRDHRPLPHAARELVGIVAGPAGGVGDPDVLEQLDRPMAGGGLTCVAVGEERLGDLVADAVHRVQAREWILEDHRDVLAADLAQLVRAEV